MNVIHDLGQGKHETHCFKAFISILVGTWKRIRLQG